MYQVEWSHTALAELTRVWVEGDSGFRAAITAAVKHIDDQLRGDPAGRGESRSEGRRILLAAPLGIIYRVEPEERTAVVLRAWMFRRSRG
jgi:hypothetical protein